MTVINHRVPTKFKITNTKLLFIHFTVKFKNNKAKKTNNMKQIRKIKHSE